MYIIINYYHQNLFCGRILACGSPGNPNFFCNTITPQSHRWGPSVSLHHLHEIITIPSHSTGTTKNSMVCYLNTPLCSYLVLIKIDLWRTSRSCFPTRLFGRSAIGLECVWFYEWGRSDSSLVRRSFWLQLKRLLARIIIRDRPESFRDFCVCRY